MIKLRHDIYSLIYPCKNVLKGIAFNNISYSRDLKNFIKGIRFLLKRLFNIYCN